MEHRSAGQGADFRFQLLAPDGSAPKDMALYMGMLGHAAFVKTDGTVFAHIHPNGSVPMATLMRTPAMPMQMPDGMEMSLPNEVAFPYGLPTPGKYRVVNLLLRRERSAGGCTLRNACCSKRQACHKRMQLWHICRQASGVSRLQRAYLVRLKLRAWRRRGKAFYSPS